jgi:hypothetical protein
MMVFVCLGSLLQPSSLSFRSLFASVIFLSICSYLFVIDLSVGPFLFVSHMQKSYDQQILDLKVQHERALSAASIFALQQELHDLREQQQVCPPCLFVTFLTSQCCPLISMVLCSTRSSPWLSDSPGRMPISSAI